MDGHNECWKILVEKLQAKSSSLGCFPGEESRRRSQSVAGKRLPGRLTRTYSLGSHPERTLRFQQGRTRTGWMDCIVETTTPGERALSLSDRGRS